MDTSNTGRIDQPLPPLGGPEPIPNSTTALVLGILSIVFCWCYGVIGLTLGIVALVLANKGRKLDAQNPGFYTPGSRNNLNAGRVCGIIGICLSSIYVVFLIIYVFIIGAAFMTLPLQELMNQQ